MSKTIFFLTVSIFFFTGKTLAQIRLPQVIGHNMVLQRDQRLPIWGYADAGEKITVRFGKQSKQSVTDVNGRWQVFLDPLPASSEPAEMIISGKEILVLKNILVGEVWLCSGQSNMEFTMRKNSKMKRPAVSVDNPVDELEHANNPSIRIFLVDRKQLKKPDSLHTRWSIAKDSALRVFSAPAYFFAKELNGQLHVPVGVISSAVPGSAIEPWLAGTITNEKQFVESGAPLKIDENMPGKFYPDMIKPLAPFAIKGFLWYQGETNCFQNESLEYTHKMEALINGWRRLWNNTELPFYYVQIAPYYYSKSAGKYPLTTETLPRFWEAQKLALALPHTGMITTTDLNDSASELHPSYKWEIGRRLALLALGKTYGKNVVFSGPVFQQMKRAGDKLQLSFNHTGSGLISKDGKPLNEFLIAGPDEIFYPAEAVIVGDKVFVFSKQVKNPVFVRFEWNEEGKANLFNKEGLPAVPFRTDHIPEYKPNGVVRIVTAK